MDFIKKNYEKVILGAVLVLLAGAACFLPFYIGSQRDNLEKSRVNNRPMVKELPPVDTVASLAALDRAKYDLSLDFTTNHNLFNPVTWKRLPDGGVSKIQTGKEEGPDALQVLNIKPLYLMVSYSSPSASGYLISVDRPSMVQESKRHTQTYVTLNSKGELLTLREVKGPADKPTELTLEWNDTGERFTVTPEKPFQRVDAYSADLKYPLEANRIWTDRRVGSKPIFFASGMYNIVAITKSNVVVLAESNKKKTTVDYHPATETR